MMVPHGKFRRMAGILFACACVGTSAAITWRALTSTSIATIELDNPIMNTDSREYAILSNAVARVKDVDGLTCEIGVREGGGTKLIMGTLRNTGQTKTHIAIDPFGNIEYEHWETRKERLDYTNTMKNRMLANLYALCRSTGMEVLFFPLQDTEFFKRYSDGIPIYDVYKRIVNKYAMVFLDGPHTTELVRAEFDFFKSRIPLNGVIVFDDIDQYPHMVQLDGYIRANGFAMLEQGECKVSYIKI
jgi:hypothetical protein